MKTHDLAKALERRIASDLNGGRVFASGAGFEKADVRVRTRYKLTEHGVLPTEAPAFRIEAKTTGRASYAFRAQDWHDVQSSALAAAEEPLLVVEFCGRDAVHNTYVFLREAYFTALGFEEPGPLSEVIVAKSWAFRPAVGAAPNVRILLPRAERRPEVHLRVICYSAFLHAVREKDTYGQGT